MSLRSASDASAAAACELAIAGGEPQWAEPGSGAAVDAAQRVLRADSPPPAAQDRLGARAGEPLGRELSACLAELAAARGARAFLCGFDPQPHAAVLRAGLAAGRFELAGALHRGLGEPLPRHGLGAQYRCNPVAYFDDTIHTDEWQREVYDLARELAQRHGWRRIADLGCGSGYKLVKWFPEPQFCTLGVDLPATVRFLGEKYPERSWVALDLERQDMLALRADLIVASDVIEHLADPDLLLRFLARCQAHAIVLSTPDAATLLARGQRAAHGPPANPHHVREWTLTEFARYVSSGLEVLRQELHLPNATQLLVCRPSAAPQWEDATSAALPSSSASSAASRSADAAESAERTRAPRSTPGTPPLLLCPPEQAHREHSRTRELERLLRSTRSERVFLALTPDLEPQPDAAPGELVLYAPSGPQPWSAVDGVLGAHCSRRELLAALCDERGPHGPERALLRVASLAPARRVQPLALELTPAAQLAQLDALLALYARGGNWPDPRPLLGPALRRALERASGSALAEDLAGLWSAHGGAPLCTRPQLEGRGVAPSAPELAVPLDPGTRWVIVDPERAGAFDAALEHAASSAKHTLTLLLPWAAGLTLAAFAQRVLAALGGAGLDPQAIAPLVVLERPLFAAELLWIAERFPA